MRMDAGGVNADTTTPITEELSNGVEVHEHLNNEEEVVTQEEVVEEPPQVHPVQIEVRQLSEPAGSVVQEDAPKKSDAAALKVAKGNAGPAPLNVSTTSMKVKPATVKAPAHVASTLAHGASAPNSNNASANSNVVEEVEGHSIYIMSLPSTATDEQVENEFKCFGPINPGRVQVRSNKSSSMQNAVKQVDNTVLGLYPTKASGSPYIAFMDVYMFKTDVLLKLLKSRCPTSNDFGSEIISSAVRDHNVQVRVKFLTTLQVLPDPGVNNFPWMLHTKMYCAELNSGCPLSFRVWC
ncbi:hypothetical protein MKW98_029701 [Papaver atlanticum]|uniref:RRM domain-containing protein n=1 Tax=Papaver atlanticum TaxID=357466 RepID=A0AAD4XRH1_9MAGN|nr:hypothetical protein MKW98_029701 [Papaver atlanticum]